MIQRQYFSGLLTAVIGMSFLFGTDEAVGQSTTATLCSRSTTGAVRYDSGGRCQSGERKVVVARGASRGYATAPSTASLSQTSGSEEVTVASIPLSAGSFIATFSGFLDSYSVVVNSRVMCRMWVANTVVVNAFRTDITPNTYANYTVTGGFTLTTAGTLEVKCSVDQGGNPVAGPMQVLNPSLTVVKVGELTLD